MSAWLPRKLHAGTLHANPTRHFARGSLSEGWCNFWTLNKPESVPASWPLSSPALFGDLNLHLDFGEAALCDCILLNVLLKSTWTESVRSRHRDALHLLEETLISSRGKNTRRTTAKRTQARRNLIWFYSISFVPRTPAWKKWQNPFYYIKSSEWFELTTCV